MHRDKVLARHKATIINTELLSETIRSIYTELKLDLESRLKLGNLSYKTERFDDTDVLVFKETKLTSIDGSEEVHVVFGEPLNISADTDYGAAAIPSRRIVFFNQREENIFIDRLFVPVVSGYSMPLWPNNLSWDCYYLRSAISRIIWDVCGHKSRPEVEDIVTRYMLRHEYEHVFNRKGYSLTRLSVAAVMDKNGFKASEDIVATELDSWLIGLTSDYPQLALLHMVYLMWRGSLMPDDPSGIALRIIFYELCGINMNSAIYQKDYTEGKDLVKLRIFIENLSQRSPEGIKKFFQSFAGKMRLEYQLPKEQVKLFNFEMIEPAAAILSAGTYILTDPAPLSRRDFLGGRLITIRNSL